MKSQSSIRLFFSTVKSLFLTGLFAMLPLGLTFAVIAFVIRFIHSIIQPIQLIEPFIFRKIPYSEFVFAIGAIILVGAIIQLFALKWFVDWFDNFASKIPVLGTLYSSTRQLVHALSSKNKQALQQVVLIPFTSPGMYSIGFYTGKLPKELAPDGSDDFCRVFIPMANPNPAHGYLIIVKEKDCVFSDMSRQDAMTLIFSGGIITPSKKTQENHE